MTEKEKADYYMELFNINGIEQAKRTVLIMLTEIVYALDFIQNDIKEFMINYYNGVATEIKNYKL